MLPKFEDIHKKAQDFINHFIQKKIKVSFGNLVTTIKKEKNEITYFFKLKMILIIQGQFMTY
ncbi:hypothetical protein DA717_07270 [Piscirickettsiaceae bacterium NZ-RLO2]|nr:hypothetical protein DA717_07270 [Piscirickettsiaceae bacterium NZ-RLO2]